MTDCRLPEAQAAVAILTPSVETPEDNQQNNAAAEALLNYIRTT